MSFRVPEAARVTIGVMRSDASAGNNGAFDVESPEGGGWRLAMIASDGLGWEHVSVRAHSWVSSRVPTWLEMCFAKDLFWGEEDEVVQFHPRRSEYVNLHAHVLHLWRPTTGALPRPDPELIGPRRRT